MSRDDDPSIIFNFKNRYDAISFNINNWETILIIRFINRVSQ